MNTYEITFTRENGSTGKDRITAANEKQARKDFREIYRHSSATITDVIVAAENVPASKQQERDALDQIRAIVDTLGPDSYLATAFAGCFEDAEENIKNDFACSMKQRLESAEAKRIEAELGYNRLVDKLAASEKALEAARADIEKKDEEIAALNARISAIQRPTEPAEISDELLADLATFSSVYIERIQKAIIENAGQIAKNATLVRLLHQYSTRLEQERIEYAREVYNCAKHGTEFRPSNKCITHANSYIRTGATAFGADWLSKTSGGATLTPESDKIYVILSEGEYQNKTYRWSGTTYAVIGNDLALGETASTAYRGDRGKTAYDHSQSAHAPADAEKNVQSDWNETDGNSDAFIKNKPAIPKAVTKTVQTLSDAASKSFTVTGYILSVILIDSVTKEQVIGDVSFENATASANGKVTVTLAAAPSNPILVIITSIAL